MQRKRADSPVREGADSLVAHDVIFLLDDEPAVQAVLRHSLEARGFRVVASTQWSEIARSVLDLRSGRAFLVADLNMPGIRGEDFCRIVRTYRPEIGLVLFTGADNGDVSAAARRLGGVPFVLKREGASRVCEVLEALVARPGRREDGP
jgi:FixJ family two-component response regulator